MQNWSINRDCDLETPLRMGIKNILSTPNATTGDAKAHTWNVRVTRNADPVDFTGYTAVGNFVDPEGIDLDPVNGTINGNVVTVVLPAACYAKEGLLKGFLKVANTSTGEIITLDVILLRVSQSATGIIDGGDSGTIDVATRILALEAAVNKLRYALAVIMVAAFGVTGVDRDEVMNQTLVDDDNLKLTQNNDTLALAHDETATEATLKFLNLIDTIAGTF